MGFYPKPHFLFCLDTKKEAKKVKTSPASLKKLTFVRLKSSKPAYRRQAHSDEIRRNSNKDDF